MNEFKPKVWMTCPLCNKPSPFPDPDYREWVWLTDKEIDECLQGLPTQTIDVYARRIEIKIKDKNT